VSDSLFSNAGLTGRQLRGRTLHITILRIQLHAEGLGGQCRGLEGHKNPLVLSCSRGLMLVICIR